jgi:hypothetical protein
VESVRKDVRDNMCDMYTESLIVVLWQGKGIDNGHW